MSEVAKDQLAIEDVLSSIRRLVAEDHDVVHRRGGQNGTNDTPPSQSSSAPKLVLTDAQRVADSHAAGGMAPVTAPTSGVGPQAVERSDNPAADPATSASGAAPWMPDDRLMDYREVGADGAEDPLGPTSQDKPEGAAANAPDQDTGRLDTLPVAPEIEPQTVVSTPTDPANEAPTPRTGPPSRDGLPGAQEVDKDQTVTAAAPTETPPRAIFGADDAEQFEPETGDAEWPDPKADQAARTLANVRTASFASQTTRDRTHDAGEADADAFWATAAALTAEEGTGQPTEPQGEQDQLETAGDRTAHDDGGATHPASQPRFSHRNRSFDRTPADGAPGDDPTDPPSSVRPNAAASAAKPTASVADGGSGDPALGKQPSKEEPAVMQAPSIETNARDSVERGAPAHASAEPSFDVEDLGDDGGTPFPDLDGMTIDEETLRDLIAEVVREELRGVLGQRITRNVRKMVRREIRLALTADTFD